jgi:hypothetical protein
MQPQEPTIVQSLVSKNHMRLLIFTAVLLSLLSLTLTTAATQSDSAASLEAEEYVVYSAVLNGVSSSPELKQLVINIETSSKEKQPFIGIIGGMVRTGAKPPEAADDTWSEFNARNGKSGLLDRRLDLKLPYVLVTDEKLKTFFVKGPNGEIDGGIWQTFYKQYPGAQGVLAFSRVGFNSKKDEALVYVANQSGLVGGSGRFVLLSRSSGNWAIQKQVLIWIS